LHYAQNPYDQERYSRILELASHYYGRALDLPSTEVRQRLAGEPSPVRADRRSTLADATGVRALTYNIGRMRFRFHTFL
jgi:hypothetical protein